MRHILGEIRSRARLAPLTIVLPEAHDERVVKAALHACEESLARIILLGDVHRVTEALEAAGRDDQPTIFSDIEIVDPKTSDLVPEMARLYRKLREHDGVDLADAEEVVRNPILFGVFMVSNGLADGCVAGAVTPTGDVLRAAFHTIGVAAGASSVSGAFLMVLPEDADVPEHILLFADCAVSPRPGRSQLADIAAATAATREWLIGDEPIVAMLSSSTKGSVPHKDAKKVARATKLLRETAPELAADGELNVDAALVLPTVEQRGCADGLAESNDPGVWDRVAGRANVLIFPDLDAANISYKLVERLCGARAVGPILQGLAKPINDLSRGASVEDVVDVIALTVVQAQCLG